MDVFMLIATLITTATVVAFVIISKRTPEMSVKSMRRPTNGTKGDKR